MEKIKVLLLGGNGFIGRNIVEKLQAQAVQVVVGSRKAAVQNKSLKIKMQQMLQAEDWLPILKNFDVVINAVGILRARGYFNQRESYNNVHTISVKSLADACAKLQIKLIHISAIGLSATAKSGFITSKYWGEQAVLSSGATAVIVRASLLDGQGGYGAKWFRRVASWPMQFVMKSEGLVAPLQVTDLGEAVANLVVNKNANVSKIIELGGSEIVSIPTYLQLLRKRSGKKKAFQISVPKWIVRFASHVFDVFSWTPLSFGHFELMQGCNVPVINSLPVILGRQPNKIGESSIELSSVERINKLLVQQ